MRRHKEDSKIELKMYERMKLERGEWLATFPVGYKVILNDKRTKYSQAGQVFIDEEKAPQVKKLFELYATGTISLSDICKEPCAKALFNRKTPIMSSIHRVLKNPFYIGIMVYKGHSYKHNYPHLIDKKLFELAQTAMLFNSKHALYAEKFEVLPVAIPLRDEVRTQEPVIITVEDKIKHLCMIPHSADQLINIMDIPLAKLQYLLLDLEFRGELEENGGLWKTKGK